MTASSSTLRVAGPRASLPGAYALAVASSIFWSSNTVAVKFILREIPAYPAAALRICLTASVFLLIRLVSRRIAPFRWSEMRPLLDLGVVGIACGFSSITIALSYTSVSHVVFIVALAPLTVMLYGAARGHDRITVLRLLGTALSLTGVALLAMNQPAGNPAGLVGDLFAIAGMFCFSFFALRSKSFSDVQDSITLVSGAFIIAGIAALPFFIYFAGFAHAIGWEAMTWTGWTALAYSGTLGSVAAYLCFYASLRVLTASQVTAFHYIQPALATLMGFVMLGERLDAQFTAAAALILAGLFLAERRP